MSPATATAKSRQSCPTMCNPIDGSPPGSSVPGILQARTLEWVAISFSNAWKWKSERDVVQSCPTLSNPMDCSPPSSSVHGIFQARVLEWGAIVFSVFLQRCEQIQNSNPISSGSSVWLIVETLLSLWLSMEVMSYFVSWAWFANFPCSVTEITTYHGIHLFFYV